MMDAPKEIPGLFLDPALNLDDLERDIRAALKTAWLMLGLLVAVSLACTAFILAPRLLG